MVLHSLPRRNPRKKIKPFLQESRRSKNHGEKRVRAYEKFDTEKFKELKELVHDRVQKREQLFSHHLSSLPTDISGSTESHQARPTEGNQQQVAIESFLQLGDKEPGSVAKIQSLLADQDPFSSDHDLLSTSYCEPRVEDLLPVIEDVIKNGFPDSEKDTALVLKDAGIEEVSTEEKYPECNRHIPQGLQPPNMVK